jgi:hypothetical protein
MYGQPKELSKINGACMPRVLPPDYQSRWLKVMGEVRAARTS